jgi:GNAT superfamily N-acetyltransferase
MRSASQILGAAGIDELPSGVAASLRCPVRAASPWFTRLWHPDVAAVTLPWAVFVRPSVLDGDPEQVAALVLHELVHVDQWRRHGIARFLVTYLAEYARGRAHGLTHAQAYLAIGFETEARRQTEIVLQLSAAQSR